MPSDFLYTDVKGFSADITALRAFYENEVADTPATPYFDGDAQYVGWSVTSRDGSISDGVKRIPLKGEPGAPRNVRAIYESEICRGPLKAALDDLFAMGLKPYRARIMTLAEKNVRMKFHVDAYKECWRLHVPIITTPGSFFEWSNQAGGIVRKHLPADGRAWLVRVDVSHRAVNVAEDGGARTHFLMSLSANPPKELFAGDSMRISTLAEVQGSQTSI